MKGKDTQKLKKI